MGHQRDYSEDVAAIVDAEIKKLIENAHNEAWQILVDNRDVLDRLVLELLEKETLNKQEVATIFNDLRRVPQRPAWTGSHVRIPSNRPPIMTPKEIALANGVAEDGPVTNPYPPDNRPAYEPNPEQGRPGRPLWDPPSA
jgi:cell division protease FtsH